MSALTCAVLFVGLVTLGQTEVPITSRLAPVIGWITLVGAPVALVASVVLLVVK